MSKGWTEERRKKQAEAIRRWKPWEKSTGPRTEAGKNNCKMNALKLDRQSLSLKEAEKALKANRDFIKHIRSFWIISDSQKGLFENTPESGNEGH